MTFSAVEEQYERNKDLRAEDLASLREWLGKQYHLPEISELQLILFLHSCYYSLEKTKLTIDKYYTYKSAWPEVFTKRNPHDTKIRNDMDMGLFTLLKKETPENYNIFYTTLMDFDLNKYVFKDVLKIMDMNISLQLLQRGTAEGLVVVCDMREFTVGHVLKTNVMDVKKFLAYVQNALPVRLKAFYFVNVGSIADLFMPLIKPFINKELLDYLYFLDSYDKLFQNINRELFPSDLGGEQPSLKELHESMIQRLTEDKDYFIADEQLISNENNRDRRPSYMDRDFGIGADGSFKKLNFD